MSAKDIFHQAVRAALEKDQWKITHDPLTLKVSDIEFRIDLGAERVLGAEKAGQKIAVEIKSFLGESMITNFHLAIGQTLNYRSALRKKQPERTLYLAIPFDIYEEFFLNEFIQEILQEHQLKLLIFSPEEQEVSLWKE